MKIRYFFLFVSSILILSCTKENEVTDIEDITIGSQIWMQKNLEVSCYRNGDPIPQVQNPTQWGELTTGAWCYYENKTNIGKIYGKLYNWYAVNDSRGLAPKGWHVPTDTEWITLINYLGSADAGGKIKSTTLWVMPNEGATNSSGFAALPGGYRNHESNFKTLSYYGGWWSSSEYGTNDALDIGLSSFYSYVYKGYYHKRVGHSVRCVKDNF